MPIESKRDLSIDATRAISAIAIVFLHSTIYVLFYFYKNKGLEQQFLTEVPKYLAFTFSFNKSVDIFFALSAFLLGRQLFREINASGTISYSNYYLSRFFRIYPLFLIALILYSFQFTISDLPKILHNLIFIDNFTYDTIIPVGWSLSIEVQFYVILPFLILFCDKLGKWSPAPVFITLLLASLLIRYVILSSNPGYYSGNLYYALLNHNNSDNFINSIYYSTYARFGTLILGLLWAYLYQCNKAVEFIKNINPFTVKIIFIAILFIAISSFLFPFDIIYAMDEQSNYPLVKLYGLVVHRVVFVASVIALLVLTDICLLLKRTKAVLKKILVHRFLGFFSTLSYPIYLFHFPFIAIAYVIILGTTDVNSIESISLTQAYLAFLLALLLVSLFSIVLHRFIEKPCIKKGKIIALKLGKS